MRVEVRGEGGRWGGKEWEKGGWSGARNGVGDLLGGVKGQWFIRHTVRVKEEGSVSTVSLMQE